MSSLKQQHVLSDGRVYQPIVHGAGCSCLRSPLQKRDKEDIMKLHYGNGLGALGWKGEAFFGEVGPASKIRGECGSLRDQQVSDMWMISVSGDTAESLFLSSWGKLF